MKLLPICLALSTTLTSSAVLAAEPQLAHVTLSLSEIIGPTKPLILGQNVSALQEGPGLHVVDEATGRIYPEIIKAFKELRPTIVRYPGGLYGNFRHWDQTIGPMSERKKQSVNGELPPTFPYMGVDEFMALLSAVDGCQALMIVNISKSSQWQDGTSREAAAWVAYCNAMPDDHRELGVDETGRNWKTAGFWATQRAKNGHPAPYHVKYWELGNELNQSAPRQYKSREYLLTAEEYAERSRDFINRMKAVDPTIKIGLHGYAQSCKPPANPVSPKGGGAWMPTVLNALNGKFDFFVWHHYNTFNLKTIPDRDTFCKAVLAWTQGYYEPDLKRVKGFLRDMAPSSQIWLTEYYRYDGITPDESRGRNLIVALGNADFIMQNIVSRELDAAQYFGFIVGGNGTIFAGDGKTYFGQKAPLGTCLRFPIHWVFALFGNSTFREEGGTILNPTVACSQYTIMDHGVDHHVPVLRAVAATSKDGSRLDIILLNKSLDGSINATVEIPVLQKKLTCIRAVEFNNWKQHSEYPLFEGNDLSTQNVCLKDAPVPSIHGVKFTGTLSAHSLTMYSCDLK